MLGLVYGIVEYSVGGGDAGCGDGYKCHKDEKGPPWRKVVLGEPRGACCVWQMLYLCVFLKINISHGLLSSFGFLDLNARLLPNDDI
jgi:hypothetical protein